MTTKKYKKIREVYSKFVYKVLDTDKEGRENLINAGKKLKFWDGNQMVFETEEETNVLVDYLLYEYNGRSNRLVDHYQNEQINLNSMEKEILQGMVDNHNSLFKVQEIDKEKSILNLLDTQSKLEYKLKDISFSQTIEEGILMYTRLIPIEDIFMTSGLSFCFNGGNRLKLLTLISRQYQNSEIEETLFEKMHRCNKSYGIEIEYKMQN